MYMSQPNCDLLVFSHLRWDFIYQRPQHIMARQAQHRRVFFFEEPLFDEDQYPQLQIQKMGKNLNIIVPHLPQGTKPANIVSHLRSLVDQAIDSCKLYEYSAWYYTPMAWPYTQHLRPLKIIYDCMDELSLFHGAPPHLLSLESELFHYAHLVYTGGVSLYEHKKLRHRNIHPIPSSIDMAHFRQARMQLHRCADQDHIPHPRIGFYGVIDERMDIDLVKELAQLSPDYHFVLIGPVVKIDPKILPQGPNIHYLGPKSYQELPLYVSGWDCAFMPFARNNSTKFISPTKTPEFLAAGKPVVSTAIDDVVHPYYDLSLIYIANEASQFRSCLVKAMAEKSVDQDWQIRVDHFLAQNSWDKTFNRMAQLEESLYLRPQKDKSSAHALPLKLGTVS